MKNIKKLLSIVMVLAMVLSLGVSALAATAPTTPPQSATVTLPADYEGHTMVAYKIFEGRKVENEESVVPGPFGVASDDLGVTGWTAGVNVEGLLKALSEKYNTDLTAAGKHTFAESMTAVQAAEAISDAMTLAGFDARVFAQLVAPFVKGSTSETFAEQADHTQTAELDSGYWIIIDETPGKTDADDFSYSSYLLQVVGGENMTLSKKVDKPTVEKKVNNVDSVVAKGPNGEELGDDLTFTLTATLPGNYADYVASPNPYFMQFMDTMDPGLTLDENSFVVTLERKDGDEFKVQGEGQNVSTQITPSTTDDGTSFTYTIENLKELFANAQAGDHIVLTYTAKLNGKALFKNYNEVELKYSNNPNTEQKGTTPKDIVTVFTLFLDVNKVQPGDTDGTTKPLDGAAFRLSIYDETTKTWKVLKDAEVVEVKDAEGTVVSYTVDFDQLGAGFYKLEESVVPAGFNKAPDLYFKVTAESQGDTKENFELKTLTVTMTDAEGNPNGSDNKITVEQADGGKFTGDMETDVLNTNGMQLPETGGIGTTIFYIVGAILVAGAVILLVTKRRVNGAEK